MVTISRNAASLSRTPVSGGNPYIQVSSRMPNSFSLIFTLYIVAAICGWLMNNFQPFLIAFQISFGLYLCMQVRRIPSDAERKIAKSEYDANLFKKVQPTQVSKEDLQSGASLFRLGAFRIAISRNQSGTANIESIVEGLLHELKEQLAFVKTCIDLAIDFGLLGTVLGLSQSFSHLATAAQTGSEEFQASAIGLVAGFGLAISTTIVGLGTAIFAKGSFVTADVAVERLRSELRTLLGMLKTEGEED